MTIEMDDFSADEAPVPPEGLSEEVVELNDKIKALTKDLEESRAYSEKLQGELTECEEHSQFLEEDLDKAQKNLSIKTDVFEDDRAKLEEQIAHHKDLESQLNKEIKKLKESIGAMTGQAAILGLVIVCQACLVIFLLV